MHPITKVVLGTAMALSLMVPAIASATGLTSDQVNSVIGLLQSFNVDSKTISTVQGVLTGQPAARRPDETVSVPVPRPEKMMPPGQVAKAVCIKLLRDLRVGSQGEDVKGLQKMLLEDHTTGFEGSATGFFGPKTAEAVKRLQMINNIASSTTGNVGPMTRGFFERRCGKGLEKGEEKMPSVSPQAQ